MTAFSPGQSPPPVNMPIFIVCSFKYEFRMESSECTRVQGYGEMAQSAGVTVVRNK